MIQRVNGIKFSVSSTPLPFVCADNHSEKGVLLEWIAFRPEMREEAETCIRPPAVGEERARRMPDSSKSSRIAPVR